MEGALLEWQQTALAIACAFGKDPHAGSVGLDLRHQITQQRDTSLLSSTTHQVHALCTILSVHKEMAETGKENAEYGNVQDRLLGHDQRAHRKDISHRHEINHRLVVGYIDAGLVVVSNQCHLAVHIDSDIKEDTGAPRHNLAQEFWMPRLAKQAPNDGQGTEQTDGSYTEKHHFEMNKNESDAQTSEHLKVVTNSGIQLRDQHEDNQSNDGPNVDIHD
jgi:hypothetical protein